jgi:hypothetical protein
MADDLWDNAAPAPSYLRVKKTPRARASDFSRKGGAMLRDTPALVVARDPAAFERARRKRAAAIRAAGGQTIEAYRPGFVQQGYDAAENAIAGLRRGLFGESERDAALSAASSAEALKLVPEGLLGLAETENSARNILSGEGGVGDYVNAGLMLAPAAGRIPGVRQLATRGAETALAKYLTAPSRRFSVGVGDRPQYLSREAGPFLEVAREGVEPQIVPEMRSAPNIRAMREIMADPERNPALRMANDLAVQRTGAPLPSALPVASFRRQSGIARAQRAAAEGSPEYKSATFEAYGNQMPELVEKTGAQNYDQLMEATYRALDEEAKQQFDKLPVKTRYHYGEGEYATPSAMFRGVLGEGNLNVFRGGDPHPFLSEVDPVTGLNANEKFRAVHDFIGHLARGATFRPGGEEIAYATHAQTMSPLAQLALLSETRGQNSLVNFSPLNVDLLNKTAPIKARITELQNLDDMRGRPGASAAEIADLNRQLRELGRETVFAPNTPGLLPPEYLDPMTPGGVPDWLRAVIKPTGGTAPERAVHLSHTPGLTATDPSFYGTGHQGRDWAVRGAKGSPREKTSFYLGDTGTVRPEKLVADVSPYAYETRLSNLYDIGQDPERLVELARAVNFGRPAMRNTVPAWVPDLTRLAREYGYAGIRNPEFTPGQAAADVFDPVEGLRAISRGERGYAMGGHVEEAA